MRASSRAERIFAATSAVVLFVLHLDFWREPAPTLLLGFVPEELAYRLAWMVLAALWVAWFCGRFFGREPEA